MSMTPSFDPARRVDPPGQGTELEILLAYLNYQRDTFRWKTGGLTTAQLSTRLAPAEMTLGGMIKHLALVDVSWLVWFLHGEELGEPWAPIDFEKEVDWDWRSAADDTPEELSALYERNVSLANDGIDRALAVAGLDTLPAKTGSEPLSLRWILTHLIEEYARHNGHADLIRQSIDGKIGE